MHWQDLIFAVGQIIFVIALIPSIKGADKPAFITSLSTGIILVTFALTYFSLALWFSGLGASATSFCWLLLAYQKHRQNK